MSKPHYKLKRIQHIKKGDVIYDQLHGGMWLRKVTLSKKVGIEGGRDGNSCILGRIIYLPTKGGR